MAVKLRVISDHYRDLGEERSRVFGVSGGSIGRAPDNDWVLPDPDRIVSGHHCQIEYRGGSYWLTDSSTNGVFINGSRKPVSATGPATLQDGDRLQIGDFEVLVSIDGRTDFLPSAGEAQSSAKHLDSHLGANLALDNLLSPRDAEQSGSISIRNAYGIKVPRDIRRAATAAATALAEETDDEPPPPPMSTRVPAPARSDPPDWATRTQPITREELADAIARRQGRLEAIKQNVPVHRKAATWSDLQSAVQAFCRGAGIEPSALSTEAQEMLPLLAGQVLREVVVGLRDVLQAHRNSQQASLVAERPAGTNPLRSASASVDKTLLELLESHGRIYGGAVDTLREVLRDIKDHEQATATALPEGVRAVVGQLDPQKVLDQIKNGRASELSPGEDPRPRYWEHFAELHRVLTQNLDKELPHSFREEFARSYLEARNQLEKERKR